MEDTINLSVDPSGVTHSTDKSGRKKPLVNTGLVRTRCRDNNITVYPLAGKGVKRLFFEGEGGCHDRDVRVD